MDQPRTAHHALVPPPPRTGRSVHRYQQAFSSLPQCPAYNRDYEGTEAQYGPQESSYQAVVGDHVRHGLNVWATAFTSVRTTSENGPESSGYQLVEAIARVRAPSLVLHRRTAPTAPG